MVSGQGTAVIDFGNFPGTNEAQVSITGQAEITADCKAEAFVMGDDSTPDHTANDHRYFSIFAGLSCGNPVPGDGFTIYARCVEKLQGTFRVRFVWAD